MIELLSEKLNQAFFFIKSLILLKLFISKIYCEIFLSSFKFLYKIESFSVGKPTPIIFAPKLKSQ